MSSFSVLTKVKPNNDAGYRGKKKFASRPQEQQLQPHKIGREWVVSAYTHRRSRINVEDWGGFVTALSMCVESTSLLQALYK